MTFVWPVKMTTEDYEPHLFKKAFKGLAKKKERKKEKRNNRFLGVYEYEASEPKPPLLDPSPPPLEN